MANDNSISVLNDLIVISKDSEEGFRLAAENISDSYLKQVLNERAKNCKTSISELQECVREMDGEAEESGSVLGSLHRGWVNIKTAITGNDPYAILAECERGEDVAKAAYTEALQKELPDDIHQLLKGQYEAVLRDHNLVRELRDKYATN